jgi:hypothetical protein
VNGVKKVFLIVKTDGVKAERLLCVCGKGKQRKNGYDKNPFHFLFLR